MRLIAGFQPARLDADLIGFLQAVVELVVETAEFAQLDVGQLQHGQHVVHVDSADHRRVPGDDRQVVGVVGDAPGELLLLLLSGEFLGVAADHLGQHSPVLGQETLHVATVFAQLGDDKDEVVLGFLAEHRPFDGGADGLEEGFGPGAGVGGEQPAVVQFAADLGELRKRALEGDAVLDGHGAEVVNRDGDRVFGPEGASPKRLDGLADEHRQRPQTDGRRRAGLMLESASFAHFAEQGGAAFQIDGEADVQRMKDVAATADAGDWGAAYGHFGRRCRSMAGAGSRDFKRTCVTSGRRDSDPRLPAWEVLS